MALVECVDCGAAVSTEAVACASCGRPMASASEAAPAGDEAVDPQAVAKERQRTAAVAMMIGGGAGVVGSFMPWVTVQSVFGTINANGIDGDGQITVVLAGFVALIGFLAFSQGAAKTTAILGVLASLALAGVAIYDFVSISETASDVGSEFVLGSVGYGLYLVVLGGAVAVLASLNLLQGTR